MAQREKAAAGRGPGVIEVNGLKVVLSVWDIAAQKEEGPEEWTARSVSGVWEGEGARMEESEPPQRVRVEVGTSEDRRSVGLVVFLVGGMGIYPTDLVGEVGGLWLSQAEAIALGKALVRQAASEVWNCDEGRRLLIPVA